VQYGTGSPRPRKFTRKQRLRNEHPHRRALAPAGIELFQSQPGWNVIVSNPKEYAQHLAEADALLVRSVVQVNPVCAGEGAQTARHRARRRRRGQLDLDAATQAGVLVMNTPGGNAISVAEHTLAMMLAMARTFRKPTPPPAPASGKRRSSWAMNCAARRWASSAWKHRPRSGETRARF